VGAADWTIFPKRVMPAGFEVAVGNKYLIEKVHFSDKIPVSPAALCLLLNDDVTAGYRLPPLVWFLKHIRMPV
jgi:hypothetical protein